jgi:hypothetical protein
MELEGFGAAIESEFNLSEDCNISDLPLVIMQAYGMV